MPEIGIPELLIILVIVLILFGPGRLAGAGTALGVQDKVENEEPAPKKSDTKLG